MNSKVIEIGKKYSLDLGSSSPVDVRVLSFLDKSVVCEYLSSWAGRIEELDYGLFEMNGLFKPCDAVIDGNEIAINPSLTLENDNFVLLTYNPPINSISFNLKNQEVMRITEEGFFWKGKLVENDKEIYQQFKKFLNGDTQ